MSNGHFNSSPQASGLSSNTTWRKPLAHHYHNEATPSYTYDLVFCVD